jgi:protein-S-isoprenylcysteine O-methyltransferase Ste14
MSASSPSRRTQSPPRLGRRGGGWVVLQSTLFVLIVLSGLTGVYWPDSVAGIFVVIGLMLILAGFVILVLAAVALLRARATTVFPRPRDAATIAETGVYRRLRHPVYGAILLIAAGVSLAGTPLGLIPTAVLAVVFDLKARVEEAWLVERLPGYARYCESTPRRFVPGVY